MNLRPLWTCIEGLHAFIQRSFVLILCLVMVLACGRMHAQTLSAATQPAPHVRVLLRWSADTSSAAPVRYNIYRKLSAAAEYPVSPLNFSPIGPVLDTTRFKFFIPRDSYDWNALSNALADSVGGPNPIQPLANVFSIVAFPVGSRNWERVQSIMGTRLPVAFVMGQAFMDSSVTSGASYAYKLIRVRSDGTELPPLGANEVVITAGVPGPIPMPANVRIVVGDAKLQILWNKPGAQFLAFTVLRSTNPIGPFRNVNDLDVSADVTTDLDSNTVSPVANGFTDFERYDSLGNPILRTAPGNPLPFSGPVNGTRYWYRVRLKDMVGNLGPLSATVSGIPVDSTPPATPGDIVVDAIEPTSTFRIRWSKVTQDVDGRREKVVSYTVYRYTQAQNPNTGATVVPPLIVAPLPQDSIVFTAFDTTSTLRSQCIDSTLYYRVEAKDSVGNISRRSIAVGAALKDITPPAIVQGTTAEGFDDFIRVRWKLNTDCGVDQYLVYRALCDRGTWIPCRKQPPSNVQGNCGGPFTLIGIVPASVAQSLGNPTMFDDHSVPPGSPVCYAYLVKAQDHSQNLSGRFPIPLPQEIIVCQRLRDRTPPPPAIIAGLSARDSAIQVDYIGAPVQDIAAYHVYRSDSGEAGPYHWVGGMTVVLPPGTGMRLTAPYPPPPQVNCDSIPLLSNPYMSAGSWVDSTADRKHIYWYKVLGVDRSGNQSLPDSALAISTFTFASNRESPPKIVAIMPKENPCALEVTWTPGYDTTKVRGFLVFRSTSATGNYFQLEGLQKSNSFMDPSVARSTPYYYRVAALHRDGMMTNLSAPTIGVHP